MNRQPRVWFWSIFSLALLPVAALGQGVSPGAPSSVRVLGTTVSSSMFKDPFINGTAKIRNFQVALEGNVVHLTWDVMPNASEYIVVRKSSRSHSNPETFYAVTNSRIDYDVRPGETYNYQVQQLVSTVEPPHTDIKIVAIPVEQDTLFVVGGAKASQSVGQAGEGNGEFGLRWTHGAMRLTGAISLGSAQGISGEAAIGKALLDPLLSGQAAYVEGFVSPRWLGLSGGHRLGLYYRLGGSQTNLQSSDGKTSLGAAILQGNLGLGFNTREFTEASKTYQLGSGFGLAIRHVGGDAANDHVTRRIVMPSLTRTTFYGAEFSGYIRLNEFQPYVRLTYFPYGNSITGFSGVQLAFGMDALTDLFKVS